MALLCVSRWPSSARDPGEFLRITPPAMQAITNDTGELHNCSETETVNAGNNLLLHTDRLIAQAIRLPGAEEPGMRVDPVIAPCHASPLRQLDAQVLQACCFG